VIPLVPTCLMNALVHLPDGPAEVPVVLAGERIIAVGEAPATCDAVDLSGFQLTAGLVDAHTHLGLVEVGMEGLTRDADAGGPPARAAFDVLEAYNPLSALIPVGRREGVTTVLTLPTGGLVSGQAAAVELAGATQAEALVLAPAAVVAHLGMTESGSRAASLHDLRVLLEDARDFPALAAAWERGASRPFAAAPRDLRALQPVLRGELPLMVHAQRASDIEALLRLADAWSLRLVIAGGAEAWLHAEALAERAIPVIVNPLLAGPSSFDTLRARADNAALLDEAGAPVIISSFSSHNARKLRQAAGNAARAGMVPAAALRAITETPALAFDLEGRGAIEVGYVANLVAWTGDPLELSAWPEAVWIRGVSRSLESRQTALRDRYLELPGSPGPPLEP